MRIYFTKISFAVLLCAMPLSAQGFAERETDVGVTAAYWLDGTVYIEGSEVEKESSFLLRAFADMYLIPKLAMGAYFNFAPYTQDGLDINFYEIGVSIKPRFIMSHDFAIKPGLNIGYRWSTSDEEDAEIDAMGLNLSIEFQKMMNERILFGEFGFLSQPSGGNDVVEVTYPPIIYFGAGITF